MMCAPGVSAEKKAWEYKEKLEVAVINPAFIVGPSLSKRVDSVSVKTVMNFLNGSVRDEGVSGSCFGCVSVTSCARAHLLAATKEEAKNHRFVCSSAEGFDHLQLAGFLRPKFAQYPLPTNFKEGASILIRPYYDSSKTSQILGLQFKPIGLAMNDMAADLIAKEMVPKIDS